MTSDNPTDAAARKPARRRATRPAAAPTGPQADEAAATAAAPAADLVLPERADAPAAAPAGGAASLADIVLPDGPAGRAADTAAEKPARTRRRATRTTGAQRAAEPVTVEPAVEPASTPAAEPAAAEPADAAPAAEAPPAAKGRGASAGTRTRARRTAAPKSEAPASEAPASAEPATADTVEDAAQADAAEETAPAKKAPAKKAPAKKTTKKPATRKAAGAATEAEASAGQAPAQEEKPAGTPAEKSAEPAAPRSPAARGGGSATPRLATTAVLFQAPDLSTARRSRRAQAPAGPPRPHDAPAEGTPSAPEPEAATSAPETTPAPAVEPSKDEPTRTRSRRATRGTRAAKAAEPAEQGAPAEASAAAEPAADKAPVAEPAEAPASTEPAAEVVLSEDEAAAVEEVGAIESELVAEGVELVDLGPEDLSDEDGEDDEIRPRRRRRRGGRGRRGGRRPEGDDLNDEDGSDDDARDDERPADGDADEQADDRGGDQADEQADEQGDDEGGESASSRRRRRRRRGTRQERAEAAVARTRDRDEVTALKGSTRLEAKRQRRREGRDAGRRRQIITEAEFLARRESVTRSMVVRERDGRTQIAVLEDGVLVEHYVSQQSQASMVGNVYLGRVQNVLPSMEAAFVDVGKGRNAVLYAGEVNWDAAGLEGGQPRRIEEALKSGDSVLVQVTKDPIGHKGARLTSQVTLAGRYLVFVPGGGMTGISRKLPDTERSRLKKILRDVVPEGAGVIVRTAAEGASEAELRADVERLESQWAAIQKKSKSASAPALLQGEPDLAIRVVRDIFNDDFSSLQIQGQGAWDEIAQYVEELAPDLRDRVTKWTESTDVFAVHRVDEQLAKGMDRKVWLPSGGSLVIDRTEAMTVIDVNTGKFTGAGGTLEETVTRNNLEAAEEIVRQLRLRDIGGIVVIDFIDMVLESNRDLVLRRLVECLGRDRTKHQVAEVTSLGLVQMTRKRVGQGLVEAFSETCEHCKGRGFIVHSEPIEKNGAHQHHDGEQGEGSKRSRRKRGGKQAEPAAPAPAAEVPTLPEDRSEAREAVKATLATIAAAAAHAHEHEHDVKDGAQDAAPAADEPAPAAEAPAPAAPAPLSLPEPVEPAAVTPVAPETLIELPERKPEPGSSTAAEAATKPAKKAPRRARKGAGAPKPAQSDAGEAAATGVTGTE